MVDTGEQGPPVAELISQHEHDALGFIDSAESAFTHADFYSKRIGVTAIHPEYYDLSGLTPKQLGIVTEIGHHMSINAVAFSMDDGRRPPYRVHITPEILSMVDAFQGIDHDSISNVAFAERYRSAFIEPEPLPDDMRSLDARIEEAGYVAEDIPLPGDLHTILGLGTLRLAKFLKLDAVQSKVQEHAAFSDRLKGQNTMYQAMQIVAQHLVDSRNYSVGTVLRDVLYGTRRPDAAQQAVLSEAISDIMFTSQLYGQYVQHTNEVFTQFGSFVGHGLSLSVGHAEKLVELQPAVSELIYDAEADGPLLEREGTIAEATKMIDRRAKRIKRETRSVDESMAAALDDYGDQIDFTPADTPLQRTLQERSAAVRSGEFATEQASRHMGFEQAIAEFGKIRSRYIASRSRVRRHADGSRIATMLATARDGSQQLDMQPFAKELAFDTAGLAVTLSEMMIEQQNIDVFGSLFDAIRREDQLRLDAGTRTPALTLTEPVAWLLANADRLRRSPIDTFRRIGDGLAAYRLAQNASPDRTRRPMRNVSVETLHRIEAIRDSAEQLEIIAFPPGPVNVRDLIDDVHSVMDSVGGTPPTMDEERLLVLDELSKYYFANGYQKMKVYRLRPGSWRQKIPYYALVITLADRKVIVCENPKIPNSTVVLEEFNGEIGGAVTWEEMVQLEKNAVNEFGGRKMYHIHETTLDEHVERVKAEVTPRIILEPGERKR